MISKDILKDLQYNNGVFPRETLIWIIKNQKDATNNLLEILEFATHNIQTLIKDERYFAHVYAMYLLAQFREQRAYKLLINLFSIPGNITLDFAGDVVTEDLARILASVYDGNIDTLKQIIENSEVNEYVRTAGLQTLSTLVAVGKIDRDEVVIYFKELFEGKLERELSNVWNSLVIESTNLYPKEVYEDIKKAFEEELVETFFINIKDVDNALKKGKENSLRELTGSAKYFLIDDTVNELENWACFRKIDNGKKKDLLHSTSNAKKTPKIGRNAPCPCGSGKKYKKCCLNN